MSPAVQAIFWGFVSGGALVVGAAIGYFIKVPARIVAGVMAFGSGVLISALSFELMEEAFKEAGLTATGTGFLLGAIIYAAANRLLAVWGAKHRKRSGEQQASEVLAICWDDVDWEGQRIQVKASKTEHHVGKGYRFVPIFPELREYLEAALDELLEDFDPKAERLSEQPLITRYRDTNSNLRTQLKRIIAKAGLQPWPKLFQNLRSTRQTELEAEFPLHVVCCWLGNSEKVARRHYLQVTDEHFAKAVGKKALQNPVQQVSEMGCTAPNNAAREIENVEKDDPSSVFPTLQVAEAGLETIDLSSWINNNFGQCTLRDDAESGALGTDSLQICSDLARVIRAWSSLPIAIRAKILQIVDSAGEG